MIDLAQLPPEQQLDFWLGEWDVTWDDDQHGSNRVTRILGSRVIQENFNGAPAMEFQGKSLSVYSPRLGQWQQTWVDSQGSYIHLTGEFKDGRMVLVNQPITSDGQEIFRMVFYNIEQDSR